MASAFWTLEDGRVFARRWSEMACILDIITDELKTIKGTEEFYEYIEKFVYREERGDIYNEYGGFIRENQNIMFNFDLRTFAPKNREFFWTATQRALAKLKIMDGNSNDGIVFLLTTLLDMHKRVKRGEDPVLLNHLRSVEPEPREKLGPGWE